MRPPMRPRLVAAKLLIITLTTGGLMIGCAHRGDSALS